MNRITHCLLWLILILPGFSVEAQGLLSGLITYQSSGNQPVPGTLVKAGISNRTETDVHGTFLLTIPGKQAGYEVLLAVEKASYEVVNKKELFTTLRADASQRVKFYLCPKGQWERNALAYYQINQGPITKKYTDQVARIRREMANQEQQMVDSLAALAEQYKIVLAQADELAEKFALANLDDVSDLYEEAFMLFKAGDVNEALASLSEKKLSSLRQRIEREKEEGKELISLGEQKLVSAKRAIRQGIENYVLKARLCVVAFRFDEADVNFRKAVGYDSLDFDLNFEYAYFLQQQNRFQPATAQYQKVLELAKDSAQRANTLNNLGSAFRIQNDYARTMPAYEEAMKIYRKLAQTNEAVYLPFVAQTLNNLGFALADQNNYAQAMPAYKEALKIRRKFAQINAAAYLPNVALTLNNLGIALAAQKDYAQAISAYKEALKMRRKLAKTKTDVYQPDVAHTLNNLGIALADQNNYAQAMPAYKEALKIRRKLSQTNPDVYLPNVAGTLNNLGNAYKDQDDYAKAMSAYEEALKIRRKLSETNAAIYLPDVALTLNNLGTALADQNEYAQGIPAYKEALKIYRELVQTTEAVYLPDVAMTLNNLGVTFFQQSMMEEAHGYLQEAADIRTRLANDQVAVYGVETAASLSTLGVVYHQTEQTTKRDSCWQEAQAWLAHSPKTARKMQIQEFLNQVKQATAQSTQQAEDPLTKMQSAIQGATSYADKVHLQQGLIEYVQTNYDQKTEQVRTFLSQEYGSLSWFTLFVQDFPLAEVSARKALELDAETQFVYTNLAHALLFQGKFKEAKKIYQRFVGQLYPNDNTRTWNDVFLTDLAELEAAGAIPTERMKDLEKIRIFLQK